MASSTRRPCGHFFRHFPLPSLPSLTSSQRIAVTRGAGTCARLRRCFATFPPKAALSTAHFLTLPKYAAIKAFCGRGGGASFKHVECDDRQESDGKRKLLSPHRHDACFRNKLLRHFRVFQLRNRLLRNFLRSVQRDKKSHILEAPNGEILRVRHPGLQIGTDSMHASIPHG